MSPNERYLPRSDGTVCLYRDPTDSVDLLGSRAIRGKTQEASGKLKEKLAALGYLN